MMTSGSVNAQRKERIRKLLAGFVSDETLKQVLITFDAVVYDLDEAYADGRALERYCDAQGFKINIKDFVECRLAEKERNRTEFNDYPYEDEMNPYKEVDED